MLRAHNLEFDKGRSGLSSVKNRGEAVKTGSRRGWLTQSTVGIDA
jgi:hypothetical protein